MSYKVGLTGGIGSGKSTVANAFSNLGVTVFSADAISHALTQKGESAYLEIIKQFGTGILLQNGELDRAQLGDIIFNDNALKSRLEGILHPLIMQTMHRKADASQAPYIVLDIPLLIDSPEQSQVDRILVVDCEMNTRIERIKQRNGWSEKKIKAVMSAQTSALALLKDPDLLILDEATRALDQKNEDHIRDALTRLHGSMTIIIMLTRT